MGRPSVWNEPELLTSAMAVFRRKGFAQTTVRDLQEATDLHPGSLYKAYGSKKGMFGAALSAYTERVVASRIAAHLEREDDPLGGIRSYFASTFEGRSHPDPGCLVTNTAIEGYSLDPAARAAVSAGLESSEGGFLRALKRARAKGQISRSANVETLAVRLLVLYQGLLVLVRAGTPKARLAAISDDIMCSIGATTKKGRRR